MGSFIDSLRFMAFGKIKKCLLGQIQWTMYNVHVFTYLPWVSP